MISVETLPIQMERCPRLTWVEGSEAAVTVGLLTPPSPYDGATSPYEWGGILEP
jgi:hypothetical protein